jgi:hypothetical protein
VAVIEALTDPGVIPKSLAAMEWCGLDLSSFDRNSDRSNSAIGDGPRVDWRD